MKSIQFDSEQTCEIYMTLVTATAILKSEVRERADMYSRGILEEADVKNTMSQLETAKILKDFLLTADELFITDERPF